jgi:NAD(P)-dependent dehydrogenase (short-subunit alcohol dehydrogenase family)
MSGASADANKDQRAEVYGVARLDESVVFVTGSGQGLGAAICGVLAESGATIVAADIREEAARRTAAELEAAGRRAMPLVVDVSRADQCEAAVLQALGRLGRIDVLVNNAGTDKTLSVEELSIADWDRVRSVNLDGPFYLARQVFPHMRERRSGQIVNIVSTAAKRSWANASAYHASKWGLLGLSHALHVEGRPLGIKVTAVIAGGMRTPFLLDRFPDLDPGVLQDPRNVAETIRFVLTQPAETVIPEVLVLPMRETSWP